MPHTWVQYIPGFASSSSAEEDLDIKALAFVKETIRLSGADLLTRKERPVSPDNFNFTFTRVGDHPLDELGRDFRVIILHPVPDADEDALAAKLGDAIESALGRVMSPRHALKFSVSMCLGKMGFNGRQVILHSAK